MHSQLLFALGLYSALATGSPLHPTRSDPCAAISNSTWVKPSELHSCFSYFPFNTTLRDNIVDVLSKTFDQFHTSTRFHLDMPEPYKDITIDILGELQRIKQSIYSLDFELHQDIRTIKRLGDGHAGYNNYCYDSLFITYLPFPLAVLAQPGNEDIQNIHIVPEASEIVRKELGVVHSISGTRPWVEIYQTSTVLDRFNSRTRPMDHGRRLRRNLGYQVIEWSIAHPGPKRKYDRGNVQRALLVPKEREIRNFTNASELWDNNCQAKVSTNGRSLVDRISVAQAKTTSPKAGIAHLSEDPYSVPARFQSDPIYLESTVAVGSPSLAWSTTAHNSTSRFPNTWSHGERERHGRYALLFRQLQQNALDGLDAVKSKGASRLLIDVTNNGGGTICLASWLHRVLAGPEPGLDFQPGMNGSVRARELPRKIVNSITSDRTGLGALELIDSFYTPSEWKDVDNKTFPANYNWLEPGLDIQINGIADLFSQRIGDTCLPFHLDPPTTRPFEFENIAIMSNGRCASSCSLFSILMHTKYNVKTVVVGGKPGTTQQYCGVVGGQSSNFAQMDSELKTFGLKKEPLSPPDFLTIVSRVLPGDWLSRLLIQVHSKSSSRIQLNMCSLFFPAPIQRWRSKGYQKSHGFPSPRSFPIVGNAFSIPSGPQHMAFMTLGKQLNTDVFLLKAFGQSTLVLNSAQAASELLDKRSAKYSDRNIGPMLSDPRLMDWSAGAATARYGDLWRHYRRMLNNWLNAREVVQFRNLQQHQARLLLRRLLKLSEHSKPFYQVRDEFFYAMASTMFRLAYGYHLQDFIVNVAPILAHIPDWFPGASWKRVAKEWRTNKQKALDEPYEWAKSQVVHLRIRSASNHKLVSDLSTQERDKRLKELAFVIYAGGTDTSASLLVSFVAAMVQNPSAQLQAQKELDHVLGPVTLPTVTDKERLPAMSRDEAYYPDPEVFDPNRYLDPEIPQVPGFGWGRRKCPGTYFADNSAFISIASLLSVFTFSKKLSADGHQIEPSIEQKSNSLVLSDFLALSAGEAATYINRLAISTATQEYNRSMLTFTSPTVLGLARQQARTFFSRRWMSLWSEVKEIASRKKVTIQNLRSLKQKGTPITTLTAYGYPSGVRCERADIDITFVGDSLAQVALGYDATTRLTLDEMIHHVRAVARGSHSSFLLADMPFGTYHASVEDAIRPAVRLVREGGAEGVKLEGRQEVAPIIKALTSIEIPAMAQVGLLPQRYAALSGYRVQGKNVASAIELLQAVNEW
ncbi:3-methyl-2-oxobutanoate hydroxymethyltransferase [Rhizoctonia solani]|uniref:3-methyl-2-oxobutanoate hydroxymethyltransferase n=1 Tax=Rhizoctonia solani TaxID=456999 RepID=A0A8H8P425_9AGAM|nr:3-methyl-2-oxobutanoate hydroxymethyltransferase [Rhizoctonia solani]QRW23962.1 3-methyl-2-oxobutanoate hydroxymethyltransferase [Rhizoctonia solani]